MPELAIDTRTIGGAFSVDENARRLMHYRFAENVCMTTASGLGIIGGSDQGEVRARRTLLPGHDRFVLAGAEARRNCA